MKNNEVVSNNLSFEQRQAAAFAFLKAFYTREELGYSVDRYSYTDVTEDIIDIVNHMGKEILSNARILVAASIFKTIAEGAGNIFEFISALIQLLYAKDIPTIAKLLILTQEKLAKEKETIKSNRLAYTALILILNREKGNIELKFNGF